MSMAKMQLSNMIYASSGYIWSVMNLTLLTINIFKNQLIPSFWNLTGEDFSFSVPKSSYVFLKPPLILVFLFNQFINSSPEQNIDPENAVNSRYLNIKQIQSLKFSSKIKPLSFFHINAYSLNNFLVFCIIKSYQKANKCLCFSVIQNVFQRQCFFKD